MRLGYAIGILQIELDDTGVVRGWSDDTLADYYRQAIQKLCADCLIIKDSQTIGETLATAVIVLTGTTGQVDSVKANGVIITSGAVSFNGTLAQTATDLAANINAYTSAPDYTADASAGDGLLVISAVSGTGSNPNGNAVKTTCSGGDLAVADVYMVGGSAMCGLWLLPGVSVYTTDPRVIAIERIEPAGLPALIKTTKAEMDASYPYWRNWAAGNPRFFIEEEGHTVMVWPTPLDALSCTNTVYRVPLAPFFKTNNEINIDADLEVEDRDVDVARCWCRYLAYSKRDLNSLDRGQAEIEENRYLAHKEDILFQLNRIRGVPGGSYFIGGFC